MSRIPRFHPLICSHHGVTAWWVCDGDADTEHSLLKPYIDEPCADRHEALALCNVLNEEGDAILDGDAQQDSVDSG